MRALPSFQRLLAVAAAASCCAGCRSGSAPEAPVPAQGQVAAPEAKAAAVGAQPSGGAGWPGCGHLFKAGSQHYPESGDADRGFAPIIVDEEAFWTRPERGKTFGLKLVPPGKPEDPRPPEKLWVHKVTRKIPDMDNPASWREWAKKTGVDVEPKYESGQWWLHAKDDKKRVHGVSIHVSSREMLYGDTRSPSEDDIYKAWKKTNEEQMRKWGEERAKALGWWPKGVDEKSAGIGVATRSCSTLEGRYVGYIRSEYGCLVEGRPVYGNGQLFRITTNPTGQVELIEVRWAESERYRELPCKTVEEAFRALNESWAMGLPRACYGRKAEYAGWTYYLSEIHGDFIQPMFIFKVDGFPAFVPAIKDEYFKDPKRQIASNGEWLTEVQKAEKAAKKPEGGGR